MGRLKSEDSDGTAGVPRTIQSNTYDIQGRRTGMGVDVVGSTANDIAVTYAWDALGRISTLSDALVNASFTHDLAGRLTQVDRYSDFAWVASSVHSYDQADRLTGLVHSYATGYEVLNYGWSHDVAGRITGETVTRYAETIGNWTDSFAYAYDANGQLLSNDVTRASGSGGDESFAFDNNGNRNSSGYATDDELVALLGVVKPRHALAYRIILATGLRRDEVKQLGWDDIKLNAPMPFIQLRPETTKAKRADVLPVRADLVKLLSESRNDAEDTDRVCRSVPSMETHKRYLERAGIVYIDDRGRRADFHALRHSFGTMLAKSGVAPRVAMALMRHTDMRLTMNVYTDPRIFDLAGAVEKLPSLPSDSSDAQIALATGADGAAADAAGRSESVSSPPTQIGDRLAVIGANDQVEPNAQTLASGGDWQQKAPSGLDGAKERVKGVEPSTFTLAT